MNSSPLIWHLLHNVELRMKISSIFVAFLENMIFKTEYRKIASFNTSCLEAHVGLFRLLMKGFSVLIYCDLLT